MTRVRRRLAAAAVVVAVLAAVTGCGTGDAGTKAGVAGGPMATVTYLPGFNIIGQDAPIYVAIERGYFAEAGLKVEVQPGVGTAQNLTYLATGKATFATVDAAGAAAAMSKARKEGQFDLAAFKIICAVYQRSVSTITALAGTGISTPRDLEGKRIGYQPGGVNYTLFPAFARLTGTNAEKVEWVFVPPSEQRGALAAGKVDAITETVIGTAGVQDVVGDRDLVVLAYSNSMPDLYGNVIVASGDTITSDPELVRRFREAALRGMRDAIADPVEAGKVFNKHHPAYSAEVAAAEVTAAADYIRAANDGLVGVLDPDRVAKMIGLLESVGQVEGGLNPDDLVDFGITGG